MANCNNRCERYTHVYENASSKLVSLEFGDISFQIELMKLIIPISVCYYSKLRSTITFCTQAQYVLWKV